MAEKPVERLHGLNLILSFKLLLCFEILIKYACIVGYVLLFLAFIDYQNFFHTFSALLLVCCFQQHQTDN